jgi:hypothetical protein
MTHIEDISFLPRFGHRDPERVIRRCDELSTEDRKALYDSAWFNWTTD